jgi:cytochrome d ubiquinol oxidase subunit I
MALLWPEFMAGFGNVFGLGFTLEGFSFVITVNAWMNHLGGFQSRDGRAVDAHPWSALFGNAYFWHEFVHMYFAGYIVAGFLVATPYAWGFLRGRSGRYQRTALTIALSPCGAGSRTPPPRRVKMPREPGLISRL